MRIFVRVGVSICTNQSVLTLVKMHVERCPNKGFLFFKEMEVTYRQFFDRIEQVAYGLARFQIALGDKIAICLPNCPESLFAFFGVLRRGAVSVLLPPDFKRDTLVECLNRSQSRVLMTTARLYASMRLPQGVIEKLFLVGERGGEGFVFSSLYHSGPRKNEMAVSPELPAMLNFAGECFTQENLIADADAFVEAVQMMERDCSLYPLSWLASHRQIISILASIMVGGSVILSERFSPKGFFNAIERYGVTAVFGGKAVIEDLFVLEEAEKHDLSSLRFCVL